MVLILHAVFDGVEVDIDVLDFTAQEAVLDLDVRVAPLKPLVFCLESEVVVDGRVEVVTDVAHWYRSASLLGSFDYPLATYNRASLSSALRGTALPCLVLLALAHVSH